MDNRANKKGNQIKNGKKSNRSLLVQGSLKPEPKNGSENGKTGEYTVNTDNIVVNSKVTTKDIRDSLWRCRDFELSHLWQRSIFLTTILILCFTGYGVITMKLFDNVEHAVSPSAYILNNTALVLCLVNIIFSTLWIMMAKGSKAWYERYEHAIDAFECDEEYVDTKVINTGINGTKIGGFQYQNLKEYDEHELDDRIKSCKAGAYSPSKINIAIGQISFVIWCIVFMTHIFVGIMEFHVDELWIKYIIPWVLIIVFGIILRVIHVSVRAKYDGWWIKSSELNKFRGESMKKKENRT